MSTIAGLISQRDALNASIAAMQSQAKAEAVAKVHAVIKECDLTMADIFGACQPPRPTRWHVGTTANSAKFRDPTTGSAWVGIGKRPGWLAKAIAGGAKLSDFAVANGEK